MEDNLFQNIKDRFEEANTDLRWNRPPDDLFDKAMSIQSKKKYSYKRLIFLLPLLFIGLSIFIAFSNNDKEALVFDNSDNNYSETSPTTFVDLKNSKELIEESGHTEAIVNGEVVAKERNTNRKSHRFLNSNSIVDSDLVLKNEISVTTTSTQVTSPIIQSGDLSAKKHRALINLNPLETLSPTGITNLEIRNRFHSIIPAFSPSLEKRKKFDLRPDNLYLISGLNFSRMDMSSDLTPSFDLTGYDKYAQGNFYEIGIGFALGNRVSLNTYLGYSQLNSSSTYSSQQDLQSNNFVHHADGSMDYSFREMMTPIGMLDPGMEESMAMPENMNDNMHQWADINQDLTIIRLGLGVDYTLFQNKKFNIAAGASISSNKIVGCSTAAYLYLKDSADHMMAESNFQGETTHGLNDLFFSTTIGINAQYHLTENYAISFGADRSSSFTNLISYDHTRTSLNYFSSHLGLSVSF